MSDLSPQECEALEAAADLVWANIDGPLGRASMEGLVHRDLFIARAEVVWLAAREYSKQREQKLREALRETVVAIEAGSVANALDEIPEATRSASLRAVLDELCDRIRAALTETAKDSDGA